MKIKTKTSSKITSRYPNKPILPKYIFFIIIILLLIGIIFLLFRFKHYQSNNLTAEIQSYYKIHNSKISVQFKIIRATPNKTAYCIMRTKDEHRDVITSREILIPATTNPQAVFSIPISTPSSPFIIDFLGCSYNLPSYLIQDKNLIHE